MSGDEDHGANDESESGEENSDTNEDTCSNDEDIDANDEIHSDDEDRYAKEDTCGGDGDNETAHAFVVLCVESKNDGSLQFRGERQNRI